MLYKSICNTFLFVFLFTQIGFSQKILDYVEKGKIKKVETWIAKGINLDQTYPKQDKIGEYYEIDPLTWSVIQSQPAIRDLLIQKSSKFTHFNQWQEKACGAAITMGKIDDFNLFMKKGVNPNSIITEFNDYSLIQIAATRGQFEIFKILIEKGASTKSSIDRELIHSACLGQNLDIIQYVVQQLHEDVNQLAKDGCPPLNYIYYDSPKKENIVYLLEQGANLMQPCVSQSDTSDIIQWSIWTEDIAMVEFTDSLLISSIENGFFSEWPKSIKRPTAYYLHEAVLTDNNQIFDFFIEEMDWEYVDKKGQTPYFNLVFTHLNTKYMFYSLQDIFENEISLNHKDNMGKTVKDYAEEYGNITLLKILANEEKGPRQH